MSFSPHEPLHEPTVLLLYEYGDECVLPDSIEPAELKRHLRQVWQSRQWHHEYAAEPDADGEGFQPFLRFDGRRVQARNYAGIIHFQSVAIYLLPKIFRPTGKIVSLGSTKPPASQTEVLRPVFAHLDFYLSYCRRVRFPFQWQAAPPATTETLQTWIRLFALVTGKLLAAQPYQTYQPHTGETAFLRGKLAVNEYIAGQVSRGQWQFFQTEQQPFTIDNLFNRIVKHTARRLGHTSDAGNRLLLQSIENQLDGVADAVFSPADCDAVHLDRLHGKHRHVLEMCRFFLNGETGTANGGGDGNFTFLLPMERVFEDFVAGFIEKHFPGWKIERQRTVKMAVDNRAAVLYAKPDMWLPRQNTVLDTKYKLLDAGGLPNQIPSADLYQLLAYAAACRTANVHLLYVSVHESGSATVSFGLAGQTTNIHAHTLPVVLAGIGDTFSALTLRLQETLLKIAGTPIECAEIVAGNPP